MKIAVISSHTPSLFWFRMDMMKTFIRCGCEVYALGNEEETVWKEKFASKGITYRQICDIIMAVHSDCPPLINVV